MLPRREVVFPKAVESETWIIPHPAKLRITDVMYKDVAFEMVVEFVTKK
jgi:hypothetical protein